MPDLERREPMPDVSALPGWAWRRTGRIGRIGVALGLLAVIIAVAVAIPEIQQQKGADRARERLSTARAQTAETARLRRVQRPHRAALRPGATLTAARTQVQTHITGDMRRRQASGELPDRPPIRGTTCRPVPGARATRLRAAGVNHLRCLAVTSQNAEVAIGYELIAATSVSTGRIVWCKTTALPGEKLNAAAQAVVPVDPRCYRP